MSCSFVSLVQIPISAAAIFISVMRDNGTITFGGLKLRRRKECAG